MPTSASARIMMMRRNHQMEDKREKKIAKVMREFKKKSLHSGKGGKIVKKRKQAIAIALSEAGMSRKS